MVKIREIVVLSQRMEVDVEIVQTAAKIAKSPAGRPLFALAERLVYNDTLREPALRSIERQLQANVDDNDHLPQAMRKISRERKLMGLAMFHALEKALRQKTLAPQVVHALVDIFMRILVLPSSTTVKQISNTPFRTEFGCDPPWFLAISPGHACNLHCTGCYADSGPTPAKLPWPVFDRAIIEAKELWGDRFFVISGGEPMAYRSDGKDLLDAVEKHSDCVFLMYTNGTLINKEVAARMARLGNLLPAISVEGMRGRTDERRGAGTFDRILSAMANLRQVGAPFGISVTATRFNSEEIVSDEFLDFFFEQQAAMFGFLFHYMPIGRSHTLDLMPTAEQRMQLLRRSWEVIEKKQIMLIDFWNHGPLVQGCISAGREGGYLYIDWNGKVMPCVFAPYSVGNIQDIYAQGGTLNDVWKTPFFQGIRDWQRKYGFGQKELQQDGNWLRPCPIRDHHREFRELVDRYQAEPEDESARQALEDQEYYKGLVAYGTDIGEYSQEVWETDYLGRR